MKPPERPKRHGKEIQLAAVDAILPSVLEWCRAGGDDANEEEVRQQLIESIPFDEDGYTFARNLEDCGFSPDAELVEALSYFSLQIMSKHREAVTAWVKENPVLAPQLAYGAKVRFKDGLQVKEGIINGIRLETAEYVIRKDGETRSGVGTLVPFEDVE